MKKSCINNSIFETLLALFSCHGNTVVILFVTYVLNQKDISWSVKNWMHNSTKLYKCSHFSSSKAIYGCFLTHAKRYTLHEMFQRNNYYDPLKIFYLQLWNLGIKSKRFMKVVLLNKANFATLLLLFSICCKCHTCSNKNNNKNIWNTFLLS